MKIFMAVLVSFVLMSTSYTDTNCLGNNSPGNTYSCGIGSGNCTWWAAHKRPDLNFPRINGKRRDAKNWIWYAQQYRLPIGDNPVVGAVALFDSWGNNSYGHVAYVESVNGDGSFGVSEQDYSGSYGTGTVTATYYPSGNAYKRHSGSYLGSTIMSILGFIYPTTALKIENEDFSGALRFDGSDVNGCESASNFALYAGLGKMFPDLKGEFEVIKVDDVSARQTYCNEIRHSCYGIQEVNLAQLLEGKKVTSYLVDGGLAHFSAAQIFGSSTDGLGGSTHSHPNLTLDFDILQNGTEKKAEYGHLLTATEKVTLRVEICNNTQTDTKEGRVKGGSKTDTRFLVRLPGNGNWTDLGREETKDTNLTAQDCHTEKKTYTIPNNPGTTIAFRAKVDDRGEIREADEGDNVSRDEVFTIAAPSVLAQSPSSSQRFAWSSAGPIAGMHCAQILEAADPHTWSDNYLCY